MKLPSLGNGCVWRENVSEREREQLLRERGRQGNTEGSVGEEREQVIMQPLLAMTVHVRVASLQYQQIYIVRYVDTNNHLLYI